MTSSDMRALREANVAFYTAIETGDMDLMEALWLDGAGGTGDYCVHPGGTPIFGRSHVLRSFAVLMAGTPYIQFILTDVQVSVGGDIALVSCIENVLTSGEESGAVFSSNRSTATKFYVRTTDGWRLLAHHSSPVLDSTPDHHTADRDEAT